MEESGIAVHRTKPQPDSPANTYFSSKIDLLNFYQFKRLFNYLIFDFIAENCSLVLVSWGTVLAEWAADPYWLSNLSDQQKRNFSVELIVTEQLIAEEFNAWDDVDGPWRDGEVRP
jgi:hypothetical protein